MTYYIVSDIHGYLTPLKRALDAAGFFDDASDKRLVVCGDMLDRGKEAVATVSFMLELQRQGLLIFVRGNHEDLLVQLVDELEDGDIEEIMSGISIHISNGTWDTALQLSGMSKSQALSDPVELARRVRSSRYWTELMSATVDYFEFGKYICVHGWIPVFSAGGRIGAPDERVSFMPGWRGADEKQWCFARWRNGMYMACCRHVTVRGSTVVCGHVNTSFGHSVLKGRCPEFGRGAIFSPFRAGGIIAIDACASYSGRVNCLVIPKDGAEAPYAPVKASSVTKIKRGRRRHN